MLQVVTKKNSINSKSCENKKILKHICIYEVVKFPNYDYNTGQKS